MNKPGLIKRFLISATGIAMLGFILCTSSEIIGDKNIISVEAEDAIKTVAPIQIIKMDGASNGMGIISIARYKTTEGYAQYNVNIPEDGEYLFWGRCYWPQVCANSFGISIDNSPVYRYGENPLTGQWHWVLGNTYKLQKGKHKIIIWDSEADARMDKFLLTSDRNYIPAGMGNQESLFFDFEDGVLPKNIIVDNIDQWKVEFNKASINSALSYHWIKGMNNSEAKLNSGIYKNKYIFRFVVKLTDLSQKPQLNIKIGQEGTQDYLMLCLSNNQAIITEKTKLKTKELYTCHFNSDIITTSYNDFAIRFENNIYTVKIGGKTIFEFGNRQFSNSSISLLPDNYNLSFDNIALFEPKPVYYIENFHFTGFSASENRPEIQNSYFKRLKEGKINWYSIKGEWDWTYHGLGKVEDGYETILVKSKEGKNALIVFGDDFWREYNLRLAFKMNNDGETGIFYNFQDTLNYYSFTINQLDRLCQYRINCIKDGHLRVLAEKTTERLLTGYSYWYMFNLQNNNGSLEATVDNRVVLSAKDTTLRDGKIGFFTTCTKGLQVDDISITPVTRQTGVIDKKLNFNYDFGQNHIISSDYADFIPANDSVIKSLGVRFPVIIKRLFEDSYISYKNILSGDFAVTLNTSNVPQDIDVCLVFKVYNPEPAGEEYKFTFSDDSIYMYRNDNLIKAIPSSGIPREKITIALKNGVWHCKLTDKEVLNFKDKNEKRRFKFSLGYTGMGKGSLIFRNIDIQLSE